MPSRQQKKTFLCKLWQIYYVIGPKIAPHAVYAAFAASCYIRRHNFVGNNKLPQLIVNKRLMSLGT